MTKSIEERIEFLKKCSDLYETSGNSSISDAEYDKEYALLKEIIPEHPFFSNVGGIDTKHVYGNIVKHKYLMGSLNKDPNPEDFEIWFQKTYSNIPNLHIIIQPKIDGSSFCLKYQDGKFIQGVTRGDGEKGLDFTANAIYINGVKKNIDIEDYVEIKGEVYKNRQDFYKNWAGEYENPRNFTAGSINQIDPNITKERKLSFIAYEVRGINFKTEIEKTQFLIKNGFNTLDQYSISFQYKNNIKDIITKYMNSLDRNNLPFDIDGVVFKVNDIKLAESLGYTDNGKRPKANRAIKFPTEQKETILEDIEWSVGRTGVVTPVGLLEAIRLAGTTVKRVTLHNIKEMNRLGITKTGGKVLVEKAGDIIPKIVKQISEGITNIKIPNTCPCCNEKLEWDETQTNKVCNNETCPVQLDKNIEHWFKKLDVKGIGLGIITKLTSEIRYLYNEPIVSSISNMYNLRHYTTELKEFFGNKAADNILDAIDSVKTITLAKFIEALGIGKIGTMAKDIVKIAPTINEIDNLTIQKISNISGFAETKAKSFLDGWKKQRKEIEKLLSYITIIKEDNNGKLNNKSFCVTGTLSKPRNEIHKMIEANGGIVSSSVSSKLDYLICGEDSGSKKEKAEKNGIKIISENDFLQMI